MQWLLVWRIGYGTGSTGRLKIAMTKTALRNHPKAKAVIYSCSGCSNVAQLANRLAVSLDREGLAEMSCIAGVGGHVKSLVRKARQSKVILALDGCQLHCVKHSLQQHGITANSHYTLTNFTLQKQHGTDCDDEDFNRIRAMVLADPCFEI